MTEFELLEGALKAFSGIDSEHFQLSKPFWKFKSYQKGDYYNAHLTVCKHLGFVVEGVFRSYVMEDETGEERNIFLFSQHQFVVPFRSFIEQVPCNYHTKAITDAQVICIHYDDLMRLYDQSHQWERFGRLAAEAAFQVALARTESFLFKTPEQRYLDLLRDHPDIFNSIPLYQISSYLGIQGASLSRIRKRIMER